MDGSVSCGGAPFVVGDVHLGNWSFDFSFFEDKL